MPLAATLVKPVYHTSPANANRALLRVTNIDIICRGKHLPSCVIAYHVLDTSVVIGLCIQAVTMQHIVCALRKMSFIHIWMVYYNYLPAEHKSVFPCMQPYAWFMSFGFMLNVHDAFPHKSEEESPSRGQKETVSLFTSYHPILTGGGHKIRVCPLGEGHASHSHCGYNIQSHHRAKAHIKPSICLHDG